MRDRDEDTREENEGGRRRGGRTKKRRMPAFVTEADFKFDYKDAEQLRHFLTDRGKIVPRRVSGLNAKQQRELTTAIKRARNLALLPYTVMR